MRRPPPVIEFPRYPAIAGTALLAVGVTSAWWAGVDVSVLLEDAHLRRGQLWRLLSSALPHVNVFHLAFNVYWLWVFGTLVEERFGHFKTLGMLALLAVASGAAEYAFFEGGVGLSGIGYGLFGMLWVLSHRDDRFRDVVDANTVTLFAAWFVLCIVTTASGTQRVANVAHGTGAVVGALLGWAIASRTGGMRRAAAVAAVVVATTAAVAMAVFARPYVNFSRAAAADESRLMYDALEAGRNEQAVRWGRDATRMAPNEAGHWFNLGIALQRTHDYPGALDAYRRASELDPGDKKLRTAFEQMRDWLAAQPGGSAETGTR